MTSEMRRPRAHALWTGALPHEVGAPDRRIIHSIHAGAGSPADMRVGVAAARGYRKCGSRDETDWVRDVRIHSWTGQQWTQVADHRDIPRTTAHEVAWIPADLAGSLGVIVEVRRSWIDNWWPSWNLVSRGVTVDADWPEPPLVRASARPMPSIVDLRGLPTDVTARQIGGEVRYRTAVLEVGFRLGRPTMSFLAFDPDGLPDRPRDLLRHMNLFGGDGNDWIPNHPLFGQFALGPQLVTPDGLSYIGQFAAVHAGSARVDGNRVRYDLELPALGLRYQLAWTVRASALELNVVREAAREIATVESSAWHLAFDVREAPPCLLGRPDKAGEVGRAQGAMLLHVPGHGSLAVETTGDVTLRFEAARPLMTTALEVKVGERVGSLGDSIVPAGHSEGRISFEVTQGHVPELLEEAPLSVREGMRRAWLSGLTYRMDTTAMSNNGASIYVAAAVDEFGELAARIGEIDQHSAHALDLVRLTLDRSFDDGPGYMAGRTSHHDGRIEDEYVQTDAANLLALAYVLAGQPDPRWLARRRSSISQLLERTRARDLDADGLIESAVRTGISGRGEWSTNASDVVSFGWKDAYVNAQLYDALVRLRSALSGVEWSDVRSSLAAWALRLRSSYAPTFVNPATGWVGGWRSKDGQLHDAGILNVTGVAVCSGVLDDRIALSAVSRLWTAIGEAGFSDFRLGLPLNVLPIPAGDMVQRYEGMRFGLVMPHGFYMNGGASLTGMRPFVEAMYRVGLRQEADEIIDAAMSAMADGSAFAGCLSGEDLHTWDGTACGYEGILAYQFGIITAALSRYGADQGHQASV